MDENLEMRVFQNPELTRELYEARTIASALKEGKVFSERLRDKPDFQIQVEFCGLLKKVLDDEDHEYFLDNLRLLEERLDNIR